MDKINYLSLEEIVAIHHDQITRYGGSRGIRDLDLLTSATFRSQASFGGEDLYPDIFSKAAALLHSLILNHPFIDGNKRTAVISTARFLFINRYLLKISKKDLIDLVLKVESKKINPTQIASFLKSHSQKF